MNEFGTWDDFVAVVNRQGYAWRNLLGQDKESLVLKAGIVLKGGAVGVAGIGIAFPATQSASTDVNTLDDYEEGNWTPALTFGGGSTGITYTSRLGRYTKVGRTVLLRAAFLLSSKGSSTGAANITGAPFAASADAVSSVAPVLWTGMTSSLVQFVARLAASSSSVELWGATAAATSLATLADTDFANSSLVEVSLSYDVAT